MAKKKKKKRGGEQLCGRIYMVGKNLSDLTRVVKYKIQQCRLGPRARKTNLRILMRAAAGEHRQ